MLCPFCLQDTRASTKSSQCRHCSSQLPPQYIATYQRRKPPFVVSLVGFSGHGKTVYLASLLHTFQYLLPRAWPGFFRRGLDMGSVDGVYQNLRILQEGALPESTRHNFPQPSIHMLCNLPGLGDRQMLMYDPPGEAFYKDQTMQDWAGFVKRAPVAFLLISLADMAEPVHYEMEKLLETYTLGMARMGATTRQQHLVIVFTKADLLLDRLSRWPHIVAYLQQNEARAVADLRRYLQDLQGMSRQLHTFTLNDLSAHGFFNLVQREFRSVSYSMVSALGSAPDNGRLVVGMQPHRVVDPLLWLLQLSR